MSAEGRRKIARVTFRELVRPLIAIPFYVAQCEVRLGKVAGENQLHEDIRSRPLLEPFLTHTQAIPGVIRNQRSRKGASARHALLHHEPQALLHKAHQVGWAHLEAGA